MRPPPVAAPLCKFAYDGGCGNDVAEIDIRKKGNRQKYIQMLLRHKHFDTLS